MAGPCAGQRGASAASRGSSTPMTRLSCMKVVGPALPSASRPCAAWNLLDLGAQLGVHRSGPAAGAGSPAKLGDLGREAVDERAGRAVADRPHVARRQAPGGREIAAPDLGERRRLHRRASASPARRVARVVARGRRAGRVVVRPLSSRSQTRPGRARLFTHRQRRAEPASSAPAGAPPRRRDRRCRRRCPTSAAARARRSSRRRRSVCQARRSAAASRVGLAAGRRRRPTAGAGARRAAATPRAGAAAVAPRRRRGVAGTRRRARADRAGRGRATPLARGASAGAAADAAGRRRPRRARGRAGADAVPAAASERRCRELAPAAVEREADHGGQREAGGDDQADAGAGCRSAGDRGRRGSERPNTSRAALSIIATSMLCRPCA